MTKSRDLGNLVKTGAVQFPDGLGTEGQTLQVNSGENGLEFADASGSGVIVYTDLSGTDGTPSGATYLLNASSPSAGDLAYVTANASIYVNNGNGWYRIGGAAVNTTPTFTYSAGGGTTPANSSSTTLATDQTATTVTLSATDVDEGTTVTYDHSVTTGSLNGTTVSQSGNVFTVTPHASNSTSFTITYSATDGINTATSTHNFSLNFPTPYGDRGLIAGGYSYTTYTNNQTQIDYFDISSSASVTASDFGDLSIGRYYAHGVSSGARVVFAASKSVDIPNSDRQTMDYIAPATTGNATTFGSYGESREINCAGSDGTRGIFAGNGGNITNEMRHITIATLGDAADYADMQTSRRQGGSAFNDTYMLVAGGLDNLGATADVDRVTIATTSNATDYGDLTQGRMNLGGAADSSRAVFMGGYDGSAVVNTIDYMSIGGSGSTNSATDFGDLSAPLQAFTVTGNGTRACTVNMSDIWMITIQTTGNSTTLGSLSFGRGSAGGASGFDA